MKWPKIISIPLVPGLALVIFSVLAVACVETEPKLTSDEVGCQTTLCCPDCDTVPVLKVIDGDTLDTSAGRVRLFGVDTPERGQACYREATVRLLELARAKTRVEAGPRLQDTFGRLLYYVYTDEGESIDEILVSEGLARAWTRDGQHRDLLVQLEQEARRKGIGCLW